MDSFRDASVIVQVYRNTNEPFFSGLFEITIPETQAVNSPIHQFTYNDADIDVSMPHTLYWNHKKSCLSRVQHEPGCTVTENGYRLENLDVDSKRIVQSM